MNISSKKSQGGGYSRQNNSLGVGDMIVKRMTLPQGSVVSSAGGIIAVDTTTDTTLVQSSPASEWASFAARYQQYRVRSQTLILEPTHPADGFNQAGASPANCHGALYVSDFIGGSTPASAAQILSDEGSVCIGTNKRLVFTTTWARNPNAKLWAPTSAAVPTANSYGIAFATNATAGQLAVSSAYYIKTVMWEVEFRGSQ